MTFGAVERVSRASEVTRPTKTNVRHEIQVLRALAVMSVLAFHLWPNRLTGGFVGLDVFFVISGFLITSHLLAEIRETGRLRIGRFWAKRAKRILPIALLVLCISLIGVIFLVPATLLKQFLTEILASTLYVQNWLLGANAVDYLAADNVASPVQHYWTLSVEEQFYIGLPLLILVAVSIAKVVRISPQRAVFVALGVTTSASLAYSLWLTTWSENTAYFSTLTRVWEFGAGAMLAFVVLRAGAVLRVVGPWLGVAAILVACATFNSETPFPGIAAVLPVAGTVLTIWAGRRSALSALGTWLPIAFLGRVSYAIYLWHWPLVILTPYVTGQPLGFLDKLLILAVTLCLSWASTKFFEDPIRFSPKLLGRDRRPRIVAAWSAGAMVIVLVGAGLPLAVATANDRDASATTE